METATTKFLKKCAKLNFVEDNNKLRIHYKSHLQNYQGITSSQLHAQNEQFRKTTQDDNLKNVVDSKVECKFCFKVDVPVFKVQRIRKKGEKRLTKVAKFECKLCGKVILSKEKLPLLDKLKHQRNIVKQVETKEDKPTPVNNKSKKNKNKNAGLIIPESMKKKQPSKFVVNNKLKNLLSKSDKPSASHTSRLEQMLR